MTTTRPIFAVALAAGEDPSVWVEALQCSLPAYAVQPLAAVTDRGAVRYVAAWRQPAGALAGLPGLSAIFSLGAGVDHLLADPQVPAVPLVRVRDPDLTARMGEWVVLHVLLHHRQQRLYDFQQYERVWGDDAAQPAAKDVRIGVMGLGAMGQDAVRKLQVLGFDVAGWSRGPKTVRGCPTFAGPEGLAPFLARTQILVVLLPLTAATRGLIDRPLLEQLARDSPVGGPILLNAGRGGLQNEADILACLADGTLRAASLDVFETEPLPQDSPFWHHPAVTITPHNAAISSPASIAAFIASQVESQAAGGPLAPLVDRTTGY